MVIRGARQSTDMCPPFKNGISPNIHVKGKKLKHLRIKAGPQRDRYLHDIVFEAKILGRRESYMREHDPVMICPFRRTSFTRIWI